MKKVRTVSVSTSAGQCQAPPGSQPTTAQKRISPQSGQKRPWVANDFLRLLGKPTKSVFEKLGLNRLSAWNGGHHG